jgi:hypothetical protein
VRFGAPAAVEEKENVVGNVDGRKVVDLLQRPILIDRKSLRVSVFTGFPVASVTVTSSETSGTSTRIVSPPWAAASVAESKRHRNERMRLYEF